MTRSIVQADKKGQLFLPGVTWSPLGLIPNKSVTEEQWDDAGSAIGSIVRRTQWAIGDYYRVKAEKEWGELYEDAEEKFGLAYASARKCKDVATHIEIDRRRSILSWSHHAEVFSLDVEWQEHYLDIAEEEGLSAKELRELIKEDRPATTVDSEPGKYRVIYADPPWKYGDARGTVAAGGAVAHYPLMSIEQLCKMNVEDIAARNAVLFMWVTVPLLQESMEVIEAWGFEYKTHFVWDKMSPFYGHYSHVQHEVLCVCTRGSCVPSKDAELRKSVIAIKKTKHSKKPDEFYELIESMYPRGRRIELFAREHRKNWDSFGDELIDAEA